MKSALQDEDNSGDVVRDAKGREILSPEDKAKREEKARKTAAEVLKVILVISAGSQYVLCRKLLRENSVSKNSCKSSSAS